ncbi:MAG: beta-lactamase family protein, partial [Chloroflexota bacterium]|nr:beta-lactamase family protein [Chloroflexota bacterium]
MLTRQGSERELAHRRWRLVLLVAGVLLSALLVAIGVARIMTGSHYLPRVLLWREADVGDYRRFPARTVRAAPAPYQYPRGPGYPGSDPRLQNVMVARNGKQEDRSLADLLQSTGTTAFLVIHKDQLVYETYLNGYNRDSVQTSFSMAKSYVSALVGIAIEEGHIRGVDDPVTRYVPELARRDRRFARITIGDLLSMRSGIHYEETGTPWGDDARTYYDPNLRRLALEGTRIEGEPGRRFLYNNYHPLLLGLVLERATGEPAGEYLEEKLWRPLGMEADGSWSLDSTSDGFEKMESGINGRAID